MASSEADTQPKAPKPPAAAAAAAAAVAQEQPPPANSSPAPVVYQDWSGFQAYSPIPPHGFFHSPVASSPQAHPYMWGAQHMMPPYGTPPPPYVMYPPGGMYAHPSMPPGSHPFSPYAMPSPNGIADASGAPPVGVEADGKSSEGKERSPIKRSKGSLGSLNMITGKTSKELGKTSGASANEVYSQSGESGSDGSSDSDANSQNDSLPKTSGGHDSFDEASQNGTALQNGLAHAPSQVMLNQTMAVVPMPAAGAPGRVGGPTTNLNIGMEYWGAPSSTISPIHGKVPPTVVSGAMAGGGILASRENMPLEPWPQDEREVKRQKRKQSNRESARRSRLRKQAECEELAQRVDELKEESTALRAELERIRKEYDQVLSQNISLKERVAGASRADDTTDKNDQHSVAGQEG